MLKIGDFSRLARISVKALRYYDDLGLLKPARIDSFTGYRYYSADQLPRLHRIMALKEMGLSLEEIARLLQDDVSIEHILDLLYAKQEAITRKLEDESVRLKQVQDWIQEVENANQLPAYEMIVKNIPPVNVVSARTKIPNTFAAAPIWNKLSPVIFDLIGHIFKSGAQISGPPVCIDHGDLSEIAVVEEFDFEIALPVSQDVPDTGALQCRELPGYEQVVSTVHKGGVNSGTPANLALARWFEANDYQITGPRREIGLIDFKIVDGNIYFGDTRSSTPPAEFIVEIQYPIVKTQAS